MNVVESGSMVVEEEEKTNQTMERPDPRQTISSTVVVPSPATTVTASSMSPRLRSLTFTIFAAWTRWHRRLLRSALGTWVTETSLGMARQKALAVLLRGFASTRVDATTREEEVLPMGSVLRLSLIHI